MEQTTGVRVSAHDGDCAAIMTLAQGIGLLRWVVRRQ
jgi:hypothetical protein